MGRKINDDMATAKDALMKAKIRKVLEELTLYFDENTHLCKTTLGKQYIDQALTEIREIVKEEIQISYYVMKDDLRSLLK